MTHDPASGQNESRSDANPERTSDESSQTDRPVRTGGRIWMFEPAAPTATSPHDPSTQTDEAVVATNASESESPSWFTRIREQRDSSPDETGIPSTQTSADANRFSSESPDTASPPESSSSMHVPDADPPPDPATIERSEPGPTTRSIVMVKRADRDSWSARIADLLAISPTDLPTRAIGVLLLGGGILTLLALLANGNGIALTVLSAIVPALLLVSLVPVRGPLTSDAHIMLAVTVLNGVIVGGVLGWLAARIVAARWFDEGVLNFGALGFGGPFAHTAGNADWLVWLLCGIVIPIVAIPASLIAPALAFRSGHYPETTGNGRHHGSAAGVGYAIGTAAVFWAPLNVHAAPALSTSDWTLLTIAVAIIAPLIAVLAATMIGIGLWRALRMGNLVRAIVAMAAGIGGLLIWRLGSLAIQPRQEHLWLECIWTLLIAIGMIVLYRWIARPHSADA